MKDLNELMRAILDMDAAQRKATEKAKTERTQRLAALEDRKRAIAEECAARAKAESEAAVKQARAANAADIAKMEQEAAAAEKRLDDTIAANEDRWVEELTRRALAGGEG